MDEPVSLIEMTNVLKSFFKSKSLGLNGWLMEYYLDFIKILGLELLDVIEESKLKGIVHGETNATFLTLVPKKAKPETFEYFQLISLCNLIYKIITKFIASRLKPILST